MGALQLEEGRKLNTSTDSDYGFHMLHAHTTIWKERNVNHQKFPIKHKVMHSAFLDGEVCSSQPGSHCRGHQRNGSLVSQGDSKVYQTAKRQLKLQEPEQIMALVIDHPETL